MDVPKHLPLNSNRIPLAKLPKFLKQKLSQISSHNLKLSIHLFLWAKLQLLHLNPSEVIPGGGGGGSALVRRKPPQFGLSVI